MEECLTFGVVQVRRCDVFQVYSHDRWEDYATIRTPNEANEAMRLVRSDRNHYRIVRKGIDAQIVYPKG